MTIPNLILYSINVMIHCLAYAFLVLIPFKSKLRFSTSKTALIGFGWALMTAIFNTLFFEVCAPIKNLNYLMIVVWLLITVVFMFGVIKSNWTQLAFVLLVLIGFQNNMIMAARLITKISQYAMFDGVKGPADYVINTIAVMILAFPLLWYLFGVLFKKVVETQIDFTQWKYVLLLPLIYLLYCFVSHFGGINFADPKFDDFALLMLLNCFAYFSYVSVLQMLLKSYENYKISEQMGVMQKQLEMQKKEYKKLAENFEQTSRLRHDWRQHLLLLKKYADNKDIDTIGNYLTEYIGEHIVEDEKPVCANHAVDIILRHYIAIAKAANVNVTVSVDMPAEVSLSEQNLCIVFGNLVENAVESCIAQKSQKKFITINVKPAGEQLAILIQNSYDGEIKKNGATYLSSKHEGDGIGISSVAKIIEENGGNMTIAHKNNVFKISALFSI